MGRRCGINTPHYNYTRDELREITRMYQEVTNFGSQEVRL